MIDKHNVYRRDYLWYWCLGVVSVVSILILTQCTLVSTQWNEWHYIIPDGYTGFLAIQYNCSGGKPLHRQGQRIIVQFDQHGLACTSEAPFASSGHLPTAQTVQGQVIPYTTDPLNYTGFALCCEHTHGIGGNTLENPGADLILDLLWVGHLTPRPSTSPEAPGDLQEFLNTRFGIKPID